VAASAEDGTGSGGSSGSAMASGQALRATSVPPNRYQGSC